MAFDSVERLDIKNWLRLYRVVSIGLLMIAYSPLASLPHFLIEAARRRGADGSPSNLRLLVELRGFPDRRHVDGKLILAIHAQQGV